MILIAGMAIGSRRVLQLLLFSLGVGASMTATSAPWAGPKTDASPLVGQKLNLVARDLAGRPVDLGAANGQVRAIDLWATWCEPCVEAMPFWTSLYRRHKGRGFALYAVSTDDKEVEVKKFLARTPALEFPILWDGDRKATPYTQTKLLGGIIKAEVLPTVLLVDRTGTIRFVHHGNATDGGKQIADQIALLLAERPARRKE